MIEGNGQGEGIAFNMLSRLDCKVLEDEIIDTWQKWNQLDILSHKREQILQLLSAIGTPHAVETIIEAVVSTELDSHLHILKIN